jgi:uncharacterized membrane protein
MTTARQKTEEYLTRHEATTTPEAARALATEFHAYYATLTGKDKQAADEVLSDMVQQERESLEQVERMLEGLGLGEKILAKL